MQLRFVLVGDAGAVHFLLFTNWQISAVRKVDYSGLQRVAACLLAPLPADLGYHSSRPMYEDHICLQEQCEFLDGKPCYYGGSALAAMRAFDVFTDNGEEALWEFLGGYYRSTFQTAEGLLKTSS